MNPKGRLIFFGNERLATGVSTTAPTLRRLVEAGYQVAAVVSHHTGSKSRNLRDLEIAVVAEEHGIPLLLPDKPAEIIDQLREYGADAGVLVAYGKIVPQSVIDLFPRGIVNIHPSALPKHRGPVPVEAVILDGSKETAVSIMQLTKEMDAGPVYHQCIVALEGDETKQALANKLLEIGGQHLVERLPAILDGSLAGKPQEERAATYDKLIEKSDGEIEWNKPAERLEREVRAFAGWPQSRAKLGENDVIITSARSVKALEDAKPGTVWHDARELHVHTGDGVLVIDRLKPAGKGEMDVRAFLAGYTV
jgi:methionyl-tRNA formyltransferase